MASGIIIPWQIDGETMKTVTDFIFLGSKITADGDCSHEIKRCLLLGSFDKPRQCIKKQRHHFADKDPFSQSYGFSSSHVWMWAASQRRLSTKELMLLNCGVGEDSWESIGLQGDQTSQSQRKYLVWNIHWKDWCWSSNTLATWFEELTHLTRH